MRVLRVIVGGLLLASSVGCERASGQQKEIRDPFGTDAAFDAILSAHRGGVSLWRDDPSKKACRLQATWFHRTPKVAQHCELLPSGRLWECRYCHSWAIQATESHDLTEKAVRQVDRLIAKLPPSVEDVPRNQMLIISAGDRDGIKTRIYDLTDVPDEVRALYRELGAYLPAASTKETDSAALQ